MQRSAKTLLKVAIALSVAALTMISVPAPSLAANSPALVEDINPSGSANPSQLTRVGSTLFFAANDRVHGTELWKSDGTIAGTKMVRNIRPYAKGSWPQDLIDVDGTLFFTANDGPHGRELWKSDGTLAGTKMVKDINTDSKDSYCGNGIYMSSRDMVAVGNRLFFPRLCGGDLWVYVSDGTATGTHSVVKSQDGGWDPHWSTAAAYSGKLYVPATKVDGGPARLWVSDGTARGTRELPWSPAADEIYIAPLSGQNLYFATVEYLPDWDALVRLWKTNGTAAGTKALAWMDGSGFEPLRTAARLGSNLFFGEDSLWKTNGTGKGTRQILDQPAYFLTAAGGRLYFAAAGPGEGTQLWASDGTAAGTHPDFAFGDSLEPRQLVAFGDRVCFKVEHWSDDTWQLWETDPVAAGAHWVASFNNPEATTGAGPMGVVVGNRMFFAADDGTHGAELWSYTP